MHSILVQNFLKKTQSGQIKLEEAKKQQNVFKSNLNETLRGRFKSEDQKMVLKILNCFTKNEKVSLNYLIINLQLYLRLNTKEKIEKDSKYKLLNKCFED